MHWLFSKIAAGLSWLWKQAVKVYRFIVDFFGDIFDWLRGTGAADSNHDIVLVDWKKLIEEARRNGNVHNIPGLKNNATATATYNHTTNEIDHMKVIDADYRDSKTEEILGNRPLVILE